MPSTESRLAQLSADPIFLDFWAGAQIRTARPVQQFLAPYVDVPDVVVHYKKKLTGALLNQQNFSRATGSQAIEISQDLEDQTIAIMPKAVNMVIDQFTESTTEWKVKDGVITLTQLANEDVERRAITEAVAAAGSGTAVSFSQSTDEPIGTIDDAIEALILSSLSQEIGVIFGVAAWKLFKRNPQVRAATKGALSYETNPDLFLNSSPYMTSSAFWNTAKPGAPVSLGFVFPTSSVLLFARANELSSNDPSALKSFRCDPKWLLDKTDKSPVRPVLSKDGRKIILASDWSGEPVVTNEAGFTLLNAS